MKHWNAGMGTVRRRRWTALVVTAVSLIAAGEVQAGSEVVVAGTANAKLQQFDLASGSLVGEVQVADSAIRALEASEDRLWLVIGGNDAVHLYTTQLSPVFSDPVGTPLGGGVDGSHLVEQTQVAIDADGTVFAAALSDGTMRIYERVGTVVTPVWTSWDFGVNSVAMNNDGTTVVGVGSVIVVAHAGPDGIWGTADETSYSHSHAGWSGEYLNVDVSWTHYSNVDPCVVVGGMTNGKVMLFEAKPTTATEKWTHTNDKGGIMSVAIDKWPNHVVAANDDPGDSVGAKLEVLDPEDGSVLRTFVPGLNGGNDFRSIDLQSVSGGYAYFASGGSGEATVFEHYSSSATPLWEGTSSGERDRIAYDTWDYVVTCDITKPKVVIYDPDGDAAPIHTVTTDGNCLAICVTRLIAEVGTPYCFGDGSGTACPCGNFGEPEHGCANGEYSSGARLVGRGVASISGDSLVLEGHNTENEQAGLYFQANNDLSPGIVWGDGLLCTGGALKRLGVRFSDGMGYSDTSGWATPISIKAGNVFAGDTKNYQLWYRNPDGSPCGSQFNASNGLAVTWMP